MKELNIDETPSELIEAIARDLIEYSVGFLLVEDTPQGQNVVLYGSGTLVAIGETRAILTAHHVVSALPRQGRLGLILSHELAQHTIDTGGLAYLEIARGSTDSEGPDLGAVVLAPTIASAIAAKKTFYNLTKRHDQLLESPPDPQDGLWVINGFVDEMTVEEPGTDRYKLVKAFCNLSGIGAPGQMVSDGKHDYFDFLVSYGRQSIAPKNFGGMSGGGLWQVPIMQDAQGNFSHKTPLLSGVVFYQEPTAEDRSRVKCHGRLSVYRVAYDSLQNK